MKGKCDLFEIAAIGYLTNDVGDITETHMLYPVTSILSVDLDTAKFELIRRLSDAHIEKYEPVNIELIVRNFSEHYKSDMNSSTATCIAWSPNTATY